jgi:hypothetical protein
MFSDPPDSIGDVYAAAFALLNGRGGRGDTERSVQAPLDE